MEKISVFLPKSQQLVYLTVGQQHQHFQGIEIRGIYIQRRSRQLQQGVDQFFVILLAALDAVALKQFLDVGQILRHAPAIQTRQQKQ